MPKGVREPLRVRFWRFVDKVSSDCWEWTGAIKGSGYGYIRNEGRIDRAHRVAWELEYGPIPEGKWVLHTCDNPRCVNPGHLYLGDRAQNMRDAHKRRRIDLKRVASFPRPGRQR